MDVLSKKIVSKTTKIIKYVQFGDGNFLRGFAQDYISQTNIELNVDQGVAIVAPLRKSRDQKTNGQDFLYTLVKRGYVDGHIYKSEKVIDVIETVINPYSNYQKFLDLAHLESLQYVISNSTEAGIEYVSENLRSGDCPISFPGKLTAFLYERFCHFRKSLSSGLLILPCELIEQNGEKLRSICIQLSQENELGEEFVTWIMEKNKFANTLVDRIVVGYPEQMIGEFQEQWGYIDNHCVLAEPFSNWIIELSKEDWHLVPFGKKKLNVVLTESLHLHRMMKVRVLNGAHTSLVPFGLLLNYNYVNEAMKDDSLKQLITQILNQEVCKTIPLDFTTVEEFSSSVLDRFNNPFIFHKLKDISLNSTSKITHRIFPTIIDNLKVNHFPKLLLFVLSAWIHCYQYLTLMDEEKNLVQWSKIKKLSSNSDKVVNVFSWLQFLSQQTQEQEEVRNYVSNCLDLIDRVGIEQALKEVLLNEENIVHR